MDKKRVLNVKRKSKLFSSDEFTSKAVLHDLYFSGKCLSKMTGYDRDSQVPKKFLEYVKNSMDEIILSWDKKEINVNSILKDKERPYAFEFARLKKDELSEIKEISTTCINRFEKSLEYFGYHFDTNFTEDDLKKIFLIKAFMLQDEPNVKLSLEDDEICDYNKRKHIK